MGRERPEIRNLVIEGREIRAARWSREQERGTPPRPLLFFNGIGANIEIIAPFARRLRRDFVTFDMPGVGGSPDNILPYRPWLMARVANGVLDAFGYGEADVMGVSWGGGMAQQYALQYPCRARRLVLVATSAGMVMIPGKWSAISKMIDPRRYADPDFMRTHFNTLYGGKDLDSDDHVVRIKPPSRLGYFYQLLAMAGWTSAPLLPLLSAETLVLVGDKDPIVRPINGRILKALIPASRIVTVKDGGHLFLMSHADEVVPMIEDFLDHGHPRQTRAA